MQATTAELQSECPGRADEQMINKAITFGATQNLGAVDGYLESRIGISG
jgi:hypothetical protein